MGLLRQHGKNDRETLLEPRRKGLFSTKNRRSEDILDSGRGRNFFRSVRRKEKRSNTYYYADEEFQNTPPVTPSASPEAKSLFASDGRVESPKPLRNVTVTSSAKRPSQQRHQQQLQTNSQQRQQQRIPAADDNNTVVSELTNPQDITPRLRSFQSLQQQLQQPKEVMKQTIASTPPRATTPSPQPSPHGAQDDSIVNRVLGLMEMSCFSPFQPAGSNENHKHDDDDIRRNLSFMPEWGIAPTMLSNEEEEEGGESSKDRSSSIHRWYPEDSTFSSKTYSSTRDTSGQSPPHHHAGRNNNGTPEENFEMVLEEEHQKKYSYKVPNRRGWMMNLGNNFQNSTGAAEEAATRSNKAVEPVLGIAPREQQRRSATPPAALVAAASGRTAVHHHSEPPSRASAAPLQQRTNAAAVQQAPRGRSSSPPKQRRPVVEEEKKEEDRPVVAAVAAIARRAAASSPPPKPTLSKKAGPKKSNPPTKARSISPPKSNPPTKARAVSPSTVTPPRAASPSTATPLTKTRASSPSKAVTAAQFITPKREALAVVRPSSPDPPGAGQRIGGGEGLEAVPPGSPFATPRGRKDNNSSEDNKSSKKVNPAAVLLRKARQARERKKAADKERRYKKILQSLDKAAQGPLPTVVEEDKSLEECKSVTSKPEVRVPGIQTEDEYLKASELLGSECVEENTQVLSPSPSNSRSRATSDDPVEVVDSIERDAPGRILRTPSWREKLGKKLRQHSAKKSTVKANSDPGTSTFSMKAAAGALLSHVKKKEDPEPLESTVQEKKDARAVEEKKTKPKGKTPKEATMKARAPVEKVPATKKTKPVQSSAYEKKPCWKAVLDSKTGRTYYYHRVTRETTWKKPPQHEIVQPVSAAVTEENQEEETVRASDTPAGRSSVPPQKQEDTILSYLREMTGSSTPFDESVLGQKEPGEPNTMAERSSTVLSGRTTLGSGRTYVSATTGAASVKSGISGKLSEQTPQIKNTSRGRLVPAVAAIKENESQGTSISSKHGDLPLPVKSSPDRSTDTSPTLPSHVPVPRRRELKVEDFSSDRKTEVFEARRRARPRPLASWTLPKAPPVVHEKLDPPQHDPAAYMGDTEGTDSFKETESYGDSAAFDSISALSEPEQDIATSAARRRALNDAIAREDWDLAANLSEGMRTIKSRETAYAADRREWTQSELDRFISENDWDAVANYIAHVRTKTKEEEKKEQEASRGPKNKKKTLSKPVDSSGSPVKRFGARSQLQHSELNSDESSWASTYSSYDSDGYSSESESFISDDYRAPRRRSKKEFAC